MVDIKDLDPNVRRDLRIQLESNRERIKERYASFAVSLCHAVEAIGVDLNDFRLYLLALSAFECSHKGEQPMLLDDVKAEIKKAGSINDIFIVLSTDCCSFINIGIFQSIISNYKINTDSDVNLQYSEHLKAYLENHRISEFIMINPKLERLQGSEELTLKFNIALPSDITKVLDLKSAIAKILGIRSDALRLVGIEEGCVVVTFLIPATVASYVFASGLAAEQEAKIRALSVLWLKCGKYKLEEIPCDASSKDITKIAPDDCSEELATEIAEQQIVSAVVVTA